MHLANVRNAKEIHIMKELVVISGKGGTGKTSITAAFASLAQKAVVADCDVDAADESVTEKRCHSLVAVKATAVSSAAPDTL